jgi:hypothetical protein
MGHKILICIRQCFNTCFPLLIVITDVNTNKILVIHLVEHISQKSGKTNTEVTIIKQPGSRSISVFYHDHHHHQCHHHTDDVADVF